MISNRKLLVLAFTLAVPMAWIMRPSNSTAATSPEPSSETLTVDCSKGKSINAAIAASRARKLRLEVSGTCAEAVVVERIGLTISGTAAGGATIDPPDVGREPTGPAIRALGAHELTLEDLTLTGATNGLEASASLAVTLTRVNAVDNDPPNGIHFVMGYGVLFNGSEALITEADISRNFSPLVANEGSHVQIADSTITDNTADGPFSAANSSLRITACNIAGNAFGPQAVRNSWTRVIQSTVDSSGEGFAFENSLLEYFDSTITNMVSSYATGNSILRYVRSSVTTDLLGAFRSSRLEISGSTLEGDLSADSDSYAEANRARVNPGVSPAVFRESEITGNVVISRFSDASFNTGVVAIQGAVTCSERSRVTTNLTPTGRTRGCE